MVNRLSPVDAVVLDMDGVLVEVSESYRRAIIEAVQEVYDREVNSEQIQKLKDAGGFNNDWHVTYALAFLELIKNRHPGFDQERWFELIARKNTGLDAALEAAEKMLEKTAVEDLRTHWDKARLRSVFQELYLGSELYRELEEDSPRLSVDGYIHDEEILIDDEVKNYLTDNYCVGILTGRPRAEAMIALDRIDLDISSESVVAMEDWNHSKPDPSALVELSGSFRSRGTVYVGDTLDDIRTSLNADKTDNDTKYFGIGVLTGGLKGESGRNKYMNEDATTVIDSINQLPQILPDEARR